MTERKYFGRQHKFCHCLNSMKTADGNSRRASFGKFHHIRSIKFGSIGYLNTLFRRSRKLASIFFGNIMKTVVYKNVGKHMKKSKKEFFNMRGLPDNFHHFRLIQRFRCLRIKRNFKRKLAEFGENNMDKKNSGQELDLSSFQKVFNLQGYPEDFLFSFMNSNFIFDAMKNKKTVYYEQKSEKIFNFPALCDDLEKNFNLHLVFLNEKDRIRWYIGKNLYIGIDKSEFSDTINFCVLTTEQSIKNKFLELIAPYLKKEEKSKLIHMLCPSEYGSGETFYAVGQAGLPIIRGNYEDEVMSTFDYVVSELNSKIPAGRLTIIDGPPGTGKSYFIRGILDEIKFATCVLLPSSMIESLDKPTIIPVLLKERQSKKTDKKEDNQPIIVIIEDADSCLVPRGSDNMSAISSLLNYTDGIFGSMFDLRIIATTNAKHFQMEKALSRSGRLLKRIHIDLLNSDKAKDVYKRLTGKDKQFKKSISLANVYAEAKGIDIKDQEDSDVDSKLGFE